MEPLFFSSSDPKLTSWVNSANQPETDFPIQNLPFGVFTRSSDHAPTIGVAIGESILDLRGCAKAGLLDALPPETAGASSARTLNSLMALGAEHWTALRQQLIQLLRTGSPHRPAVEPLLVPIRDAVMSLPANIGDYTDFYASIDHATNVGRLFRPDNPLLPNYKYVPIGYHGRASSLVPSGTAVRRPAGQRQDPDASTPTFSPCRSLDYELEVGIFVGVGNTLGDPISIKQAGSHIFGFCLLNDWSARDIQAWEYQPLGPFLAKSFATTISPWVVTAEALIPFRVPARLRQEDDPAPLTYLASPDDVQNGALDLKLEVYLSSAQMRSAAMPPIRVSRSNLRDLYWTPAQLLTHHASNGCNLQPGDLIGTGTVSGPSPDSLGCLLEMTRRGAEPLPLPTGETRKFLEDGDEVIFRGYCSREGLPRIGFGACRGLVV